VARPMIRVGQLRAVQRAAYFRPQGKRRLFILDGADTMRWNDADVFLKILEEPPESATLILLAPTPDSLLPTIRSRSLQFHFAPVPAEQVEQFLKDSAHGKPSERNLIAQLSCGSPGAALALDLERSQRLRKGVLSLLERAATGDKYAGVFAATAQFAKQENESFENVLEVLYSLFTDLLEFTLSPKSRVPRNPDLQAEIEALGKKVNGDWVLHATRGLDILESRLRRNIGRQLGLDALMMSLAVH
jgi:DNA polymerase-3 subunit delta'